MKKKKCKERQQFEEKQCHWLRKQDMRCCWRDLNPDPKLAHNAIIADDSWDSNFSTRLVAGSEHHFSEYQNWAFRNRIYQTRSSRNSPFQPVPRRGLRQDRVRYYWSLNNYPAEERVVGMIRGFGQRFTR